VKTLVLFISAIAGAAGCQRPAAPTAPQTSATAVLDAMDTRVAVPLLPMMANHQKQSMRDHLQAVQTIVAAAGAADFPAIVRAAATIGYSEQMGQMCSHMGAGAPGFTEQALRFHHTADRISDAARKRDMPGVLGALGDTLATCTGCHATFKQKLVDDTTWASLAGQAAPQHR
jgi:cytochrome c556